MDQVAQPAVITAVGDRALEGRIGAPAKQAPRFPGTDRACNVQGFSANAAIRSLKRSKRNQAVFTNRKPGNFDERGTTDTAIGGKNGEE
jgi:hypothetical protein